NSFGKRGMLAIWSFIFIALVLTFNSQLTSSSRQTFAFSRDGALPFSRFLYKINSVTGTPVRCVWFSATCAALLGLIIFAGCCRCTFHARRRRAIFLGGQPFKKGPFHLGVFSKPVAIIAVLWMWFMAVVLMFPSAPNPSAETMNDTVVVMGGVLFLAAVYYLFPNYGGRHWFQGPVSNAQLDQDETCDLTSMEKNSPI
ncbi:hypothetical protein B0H17DRAFT_928678, partial [Mycena rosella]